HITKAQDADPHDWRPAWYRGRSLLDQGQPHEAAAAFERVVVELPGELAPKLALAFALEQSEDTDRAIRLYDLISQVDPSFTSAIFGLARCLEQKGDREGAAA